MDNENHKKTWNNFTKFVLWGLARGCVGFGINGIVLIIEFFNENRISFRKSKNRKKNFNYS